MTNKRDGEEGEVHEGEGILTAEKKRRIEESQEVAYSDVNLKAVVHEVFLHHLDICMFASDKLPWYPEGLTPEMKLKAWLRKCAKLPPNSKWMDPKYNSAFVYQLMLDDEDQYGPEDVKTGYFVSLLYLSEELIELYATIDAILDPEPKSGYNKHICGSP
ncbi:hypothetical protein F5887DRAFT_1078095 [Amanita rubescens]|nr:hypothetical protein F5887DRAFT_1078095 [Amanita rubescens]